MAGIGAEGGDSAMTGAGAGGPLAAGGAGSGGEIGLLAGNQLALGTEFGCGIDDAQRIQCWGSDDQKTGQIQPPDGVYLQIRAGDQTACAVRSGDFFDCWGASAGVSIGTDTLDLGVVGGQTCLLRADKSIRCFGPSTNPAVGSKPGPFRRVGAGGGFGCGLNEDATLLCWGSDAHGIVSGLPAGEFLDLSTGVYHACAIKKDDRTVVCWGAGGPDDANGKDPDLIAFGQAIPAGGSFVAIAAGLGHTCGILENGSVKCWGAGTTDDNCVETLNCGQSLPPEGSFVQIAAGTSNSCGIRDDGSIECWGSNTGNRSTPPADFRAF